MPDKSWKRLERSAAAALGGARTGNRGRGIPDVEHPKYSIECKYRKQLPAWLKNAINQAERNGPGKPPLVILKEKNQRGEYCLMRLDDLTELLGDNLTGG